MLIATAILTVVLIVAGSLFASRAHAETLNDADGTYVVQIAPSVSDQVLWSLARQMLSRVDEEAVSRYGTHFVELQGVSAAYQTLSESVMQANKDTSIFLLSGVPGTLVHSFASGHLPQGALFSAANTVEPLQQLPESELGVPVVAVSRSTADTDRIFKEIAALEAALAQLDGTAEQIAAGNLENAASALDEQELRELARDPSSSVAGAAQLEMDRRLAGNLTDLSSYSNGQLPGDVLCEIPWAPEDKVLCDAAENFGRLNDSYRAEFGSELPILDGYRPLAEQEIVHANSPGWTAVPGTSNHGWGLAIDFDWDIFASWEAPEVIWMIENGPKYGWRLPAALGPNSDRPEPWHYEFGTSYSGDDAADFVGPTPPVIFRVQTA